MFCLEVFVMGCLFEVFVAVCFIMGCLCFIMGCLSWDVCCEIFVVVCFVLR